LDGVELTSGGTDFFLERYNVRQGYVGFSDSEGFFTISNFHLEDFEASLTAEDLIRQALASQDFHEVSVGGADSPIYGVIWGPQTDAPTVAEALRQTLSLDKLELVWKNSKIEVGKFNELSPTATIQDEIIESDEINEASRRINMAIVDGNDQYWIELDTADLLLRGRTIASYLDLPDLVNLDDIKTRAREEIKRSAQGASPGGTIPLRFDLDRMTVVTWIDNAGNSQVVQIEGISVDIRQDERPIQHMTLDTSQYPQVSSDALMAG
jgi:hypothetical protein